MRTLFRPLLPFLLAPVVCAQSATDRKPQIVLPAGQHQLAELVERVAQTRGTPLKIDEAVRNSLESQRIVLACELQLPPTVFADLAATLVAQRGVVFVREGSKGSLQAIDMRRHGDDFASFAEKRTIEEVLARPQRAECVATLFDSGEVDAAVARNFLRPFFLPSSGRWGLRTAVVDDKVQLIGLTDDVACAIQMLQAACGAKPGMTPKFVEWGENKGVQHRWPGGRVRQSALLALAGKKLGCSLLPPQEQDEDPWLDLGEDGALAADLWFARLSAVLREHDLCLVPIAAEHRVFQMFDRSAGARVPIRSTMFASPAELKQQSHLLSVTCVVKPTVEVHVAANALRGSIRRLPGLSAGSIGPGMMMLTGPRDYVVEALRIVDSL